MLYIYLSNISYPFLIRRTSLKVSLQYIEPTEKVHNVKWINNWALLTWLLRKVKLLYIINAKYLCISLIFSTLAKNSAMLGDYQQTRLSEYARIYDILIPRDHIFRRMNEEIDFSFVRKELESKYSVGMGRSAEDPVRMFKYLMLKAMHPASDEDLVKRAYTDMSYKFFLGLNPEDDVIDPSLLSKFRRQRLQDVDLLSLLISKSVTMAIAKGIINSILSYIQATINSWVDMLNALINGAKKVANLIPGVNMNIGEATIPKVNIPMLAEGGIVEQSGQAIVGEAGAELLTLPKGAKVEPLQNTQTLTKEDITSAFIEALETVGLQVTINPNTSNLFDEIVNQNTIYKRTHGGLSAI